MKFQIKKRFTDEVLIEGEAESFIRFVEYNKADLSGADLSKANLSGADLSKANLSGANLSKADLYGARIQITQTNELLKALKINIIQ